MKRIKQIIIISLVFLFFSASAQQKYGNHIVKNGETVYSISKAYNITETEIYNLNPEIKDGLNVRTVLIIPMGDLIPTEIQEIKFKKHRVKRRETLFSIAQRYNISVDDIKRFNKELYSRELKKGEKIRIPLNLHTSGLSGNNTISKPDDLYNKHTVLAKETKYGIARKYGISISELENLNPDLGENLPIGAVLLVPESSVINSAIIDDEFDFYEVQAKEGFFRLNIKLNLTKEQIIALNPYAKEGLKEGMILKIPKRIYNREDIPTIDLSDNIINRRKKNLVIMLPFQLSRFEGIDTSTTKADILKERRNNAVRIALDFYSGALLAADFMKDKGIAVHIDVYDTEASESKVINIISRNDFNEVDAVIGPLLRKNVEKAASLLKKSNTPVFSPLSNRKMKSSSNFFQTLPSGEMLEEAMLDYLEEHAVGKNIIIISDSERLSQKNKLLSRMPGAKSISPREKGFLNVQDIEELVITDAENWVILETNNASTVSNVVVLLNGMPEDFNIRLFTLDKNVAYDFDDISNFHLAKLNFTFPSINKSYHYNDHNPFLVSYKNRYGVLPNRYAVRGFDITYDILLRLAIADDIYEATTGTYETEYVENKFRYTKKLFSGYQNNAFYIIKYNHDLQFEEVE